MAKPRLRKMLCDINSKECADLMRLIETQSKETLAKWAVGYAKNNYLRIYEEQKEDSRLRGALDLCEKYFSGNLKLAEVKPVVKEAAQLARDISGNPIAQAAARAISVACATINTPTNALGFLFYGSAAVAYSRAGLEESQEVYDRIAQEELLRALLSLKEVSAPDEKNPAKINWNC